MKPLFYSTLATIVLAGAAVAQSGDQLRMSVAKDLDRYDLNVETGKLTDDQVSEIYAITASDDEPAQRAKIIAVLEDAGYQAMTLGDEMVFMAGEPLGENNLRDAVDLKLDTYGFTGVEATSLSDDQVAKIYAVVQDSDAEAARARIRTILQ